MNDWTIKIKSDLEDIDALPATPVGGRDVRGGYIRGCGLAFGNLRQLCEQDPVFAEAFALATTDDSEGRPRTVVDPYNLMNLFAIMKLHMTKPADGHIVEFGSMRGGSTIFLAAVARRLLPGTMVIGFDTFTGIPDYDPRVDIHGVNTFAAVDLAELRAFTDGAGLNNLTFIEGPFDQTVPGALVEIGDVAMAHIDCDVRDAVAFTYDQCKPYLSDGAYIVLDDPLTPTCLGAFEAVESLLIRRDGLHAEQVFPHLVFRYPSLSPTDHPADS